MQVHLSQHDGTIAYRTAAVRARGVGPRATARAGIAHHRGARASGLTGARDDRLGPYRVLDAGFGRRAQGVWINGPVDSFKAWCSCTLFREFATASGDAELGAAARAVLRTFEGGAIVYTAGGEGTAGYTEDVSARRNVLDSAGDTQTLRLLESIDTSE